jgi:hypothetical protein
MTCKTCGEVKAQDKYLNCEACREAEAEKRRARYHAQQYRINPLFEPRDSKVDGMTKTQRNENYKAKVTQAMNSCPEHSMFSPEYETTPTYCGLCNVETLERNLFKCLCKKCRQKINHNYSLAETEADLPTYNVSS